MRTSAYLRSKLACVGRVFTVALRWRFGVRFAGCTLFTALLLHTTCLTTYAQIWGLKGPDTGRSTPRRWILFWFRENGSGIFLVGDLTLNGSPVKIDALASSPQYGLLAFQMDGDLYQYTGSNSRLVRVNPQTAQVSVIGDWLSRRTIVGAAFDASDRLWAVDTQQDQLLRIDPNSGAILQSIPITLGGNRFDLHAFGTDIAFDIYGNAYICDPITQSPYGTKFYRLDMATGAATLLHTDQVVVPGCGGVAPGPAVVGMAFSRAAPPDRLFVAENNGCDDIWYYDINSNWNRVYLYDAWSGPYGGYNAGVGDLATYIGCVEHNGDVDASGCVDDADLLSVLFGFGSTGSYLGRVDVNCDGIVDDADLLIVLFNFGSGC
jgi:hypothetical protein